MTQARGRKHYFRLPVVEAPAKREVGAPVAANLALASDFVDTVRQTYGGLLEVSGQAMKLWKMAELLGYVTITPEALKTTLPVEAMPLGIDRDEFVQCLAGMMQNVFSAIPDELATMLFKLGRGGLQ